MPGQNCLVFFVAPPEIAINFHNNFLLIYMKQICYLENEP